MTKPVDHHQAARALRRMRAAKAGHGIVVADIARAYEEIGRVFDQILGVEGVDPGELLVAEADREPARFDRDRRVALPDDEDVGAWIRLSRRGCYAGVVGVGLPGRQGRMGDDDAREHGRARQRPQDGFHG